MNPLNHVRNFLFDLDGCIWFAGMPAPGAVTLVAALREAGCGVFFLTNVTGATADNLLERLAEAGIAAAPGSVVGPLSIIGSHPLLKERPPALIIGTAAVRETLTEAGVPVVTDPATARVVVVGRDPQMTYDDLAGAVHALDRGAAFLALNLDLRVPSEKGVMVPGTGAIAAALTAATGIRPEVVGKPSEFFFREALKMFEISAADSAMVGDSLDSDVAGGAGIGLVTVLVGGGLGQERARVKPDVTVSDLIELHRLLAPDNANPG